MGNIKVLYSVSGLTEWVNVAKLLYREQRWEPVYWLTVLGIRKEVEEAFPDAVHEWFFDVNRGRYKYDLSQMSETLDKNIINNFSYHESIALTMLERYDPYQCFTYKERKRLYYS